MWTLKELCITLSSYVVWSVITISWKMKNRVSLPSPPPLHTLVPGKCMCHTFIELSKLPLYLIIIIEAENEGFCHLLLLGSPFKVGQIYSWNVLNPGGVLIVIWKQPVRNILISRYPTYDPGSHKQNSQIHRFV